MSSCAKAQFGYSTKSKKAIKLFEKAKKIPRESYDEKGWEFFFSELIGSFNDGWWVEKGNLSYKSF